MTPGTSPRQPVTPSTRWAAAAKGIRRAYVRLRFWLADQPLDGARLARTASAVYLTGLGVVLTTAWHAPADGAAIAGFPAWHLALLMATGAGVALLTLGQRETGSRDASAGAPAQSPTTGVSQLMAQMSHELRTPLNAVIGFSEVMLAELHGPLGNARYHEYAHHISESGGRLLKSSEEALAVTEAMTVLMSDRRRGRRERLSAGALVRDAWRAAAAASGNTVPRLAMTTCTTCDILCERGPTVQALEHLLREASGRVSAGGAIEVVGKRRGGRRSLEIRACRGSDPSRPGTGSDPSPRPLRQEMTSDARGLTPSPIPTPACASSSPACCSRCRARRWPARPAATAPGRHRSSFRRGADAGCHTDARSRFGVSTAVSNRTMFRP